FSALVGIHAAVDDHTFLTKSGDLLTIMAVRGPDYECREPLELAQMTRRFESALRVLGEDCRLYQYMLKRAGGAIPAREYDNPIVSKAITSRLDYLQRKASQLYAVETYFCIAYEGWKHNKSLQQKLARFTRAPLATLREVLSSKRTAVVLQKE